MSQVITTHTYEYTAIRGSGPRYPDAVTINISKWAILSTIEDIGYFQPGNPYDSGVGLRCID